MQNIPAGLIPYNHEKYLTGKYIAETRGGFRPDEVVYLKGARQPVVFADNEKYICSYDEDGNYSYAKKITQFDLFLRPKTVKKMWEVVVVCDDEAKADYLYSQLTEATVREVEVNEE